MRERPAADKKPRWMLQIIRKLSLTSPLCQRLAQFSPSRPPKSPLGRGELAKLSPAATMARIEALEPQAAWACYQELSPRMQEFVAAHCKAKRWAELLMYEIHSQATACIKRENSKPVERKAPVDYFAFKSTTASRPVCAWSGRGDLCSWRSVPTSNTTLARTCPVCSCVVAVTTWPSVLQLREAWGTLTAHERDVIFRWERGEEDRERAP
jgi:hypothetical protein